LRNSGIFGKLRGDLVRLSCVTQQNVRASTYLLGKPLTSSEPSL
jgi:hypothetical protein